MILSTAAQHILLALSAEDRHGYGIMQEVSHQSGGAYKLGPGTLYDNLEKLIEQGLVKDVINNPQQEITKRLLERGELVE